MKSKITFQHLLGGLFIGLFLSFSQNIYAAFGQNQADVKTAYGKGTTMQQILAISGLTVSTSYTFNLTLTNPDQISRIEIITRNDEGDPTKNLVGTPITNPGATVSFTGSTSSTATSVYVLIDIAPGATVGAQVNAVCTDIGGTAVAATVSPKTVLVADQPITGIKTVSSSGDYTSIAAMITAINQFGVGTGGVTFNIADDQTFAVTSLGGTSFYIRQATGVNNPLIIQRSGTGSAKPILTLTGTSSAQDCVLGLFTTDYVTVDGLDIRCSINGTNKVEYIISVRGTPTKGCDHIEIKNCSISGNSTTDATNLQNVAAIHFSQGGTSGATAQSGTHSNIKIHDNTISNVDWAINFEQGNANAWTYKHKTIEVYNNTITGQFACNATNPGQAIAFNNSSDIQVYGNTIDGSGFTSTAAKSRYAIGLANNGGATTNSGYAYIYNNVIKNLSENFTFASGNVTLAGIYAGGTGMSFRIYNNIISNLTNAQSPTGGSMRLYGIYTQLGGSVFDIFHNTVYLNQTSPASLITTAAMSNDATGAILNMINNIFDNESGTQYNYSYKSSFANSLIASTSDNNYFAGSTGMSTLTGTYANLTDFKSALATKEQNSIDNTNGSHSFLNAAGNDLKYLNSSICSNAGKLIDANASTLGSTVGTDNRGNSRNTINPDLGAYEIGMSLPSVSNLTGLNYTVGNGPSAEQTVSISGNGMTDNLIITPTANIELSTTSGSGFASVPVTLTKDVSGNIPATTIYVRLIAGLSVGTYNTDSVSFSSTGETSRKISVSGVIDLGTGVNMASKTDLKVYTANQKIIVDGIKLGEKMEVYNSLGEKIRTVIAQLGINDIELSTKGLYIFKTGKSVQKLIVK